MHINTPVVTKEILPWTGQEKALSAPPVIRSVELVSGETTEPADPNKWGLQTGINSIFSLETKFYPRMVSH